MKDTLSVKDIRKATGLTRAQIAWFHHEGVVKAAGFSTYSVYDYDGYKYFKKEDLQKFQQIAMYYELGLKRNEIRDLMTAKDYDCDRALADLYAQLKAKRDRIDRHMVAIDHMQTIGTKSNTLNLIGSITLEDWGKHIQKIQASPAWEEISEAFINQLSDNYLEEMLLQLANAVTLPADTDRPEQIDYNVSLVARAICRVYGVAGYLTMVSIVLGIVNGSSFLDDAQEMTDIPLTAPQAKMVWKAIESGVLNFYHQIIDIIVRYYPFFGEEYDHEQIQAMVADVRSLADEHFGLRQDAEYQLLFEVIPPTMPNDPKDYIGHIYYAVYHHSLKSKT